MKNNILLVGLVCVLSIALYSQPQKDKQQEAQQRQAHQQAQQQKAQQQAHQQRAQQQAQQKQAQQQAQQRQAQQQAQQGSQQHAKSVLRTPSMSRTVPPKPPAQPPSAKPTPTPPKPAQPSQPQGQPPKRGPAPIVGAEARQQRPARSTPQQMQEFFRGKGKTPNPSLQHFNTHQAREQARQFLKERGGQRPQERGQRLSQAEGQRHFRERESQARGIHERMRGHGGEGDHRNWFRNDFWERHGYYPFSQPYEQDWWQGASWPTITNWLSYENYQPVYYDVGGPVYVAPPQGYEPYEEPQAYPQAYPEPEAYPQPEEEAEAQDWLPLGVFALAQNELDAANAIMFLQLALYKDGTISGTYYNSSTDETYPIEGAVDPSNQRIALKVGTNPNNPMVLTGLYNLSLALTPVELYFPNGTTQVWLLVRLNQQE